MKNTTKVLLLCTLPLTLAVAQEENTHTNSSLTLSEVQEDNIQTNSSLILSSIEISNTRTDEERIEFLLDVAEVYITEKNYSAAVEAYERILEIDPLHAKTRYMLAHIYISAKQYKKAEDLLLILLEENPDDFTLLNNLAWLYATADDPSIRNGKKAIRYAQKAMVLAPNDYHVWSTLSEAYYISGDYEKAYRAIDQMAGLAALYGKDLTEESIQEYNEQIRKCKRSMDTAKLLKGEETE